MKRTISLLGLLVTLLLIVSGCTGYNKLLKSNDIAAKEAKAEEYYKKGKYDKVLTLTEDIIPTFRGTNKNERLFYLYAVSLYKNADYLYAQHYLQSFVRTFPKSKYSEECAFLGAYCSYIRSPKSSLDQAETNVALNDFQLFLESYPESTLKDSCNNIIQELQVKLEDKAFENAKLYYNISNHKSAVISLTNFVKDYPASSYEEEARFMILKSSYLLAMNSVQSKKNKRLEDTIKAYQNYIDKFADSKRVKQVQDLYENVYEELEKTKKAI